MARGKKYTDDYKEKAYLMYAACGNFNEVSRSLGVPVTTIKTWIDKKKPDELDELRTQKKMEFVDKASEIIDKGLLLLDRRITTALEYENELEELISVISSQDMNGNEKNALITKVKSLELQKLSEITTAIGTLYDKRALAKGETTQNAKITFTLPEELKSYAK